MKLPALKCSLTLYKPMPPVFCIQGIPREDLEKKLLAIEGPKSQATKADFVKFHDDKVCSCNVSRVVYLLRKQRDCYFTCMSF